ncbi:MAG TPA: AI-2E family transporter [Ktedonobacterales bacterium]|nr:AI-2E family transporter [Ktedonobacterales bacterium]
MRMAAPRSSSESQPSQTPGRGVVISITPRTLWLAVGLLALLVSVAIVLMKAMFIIMLIFIAIIFAEGIRPLVDRLERHRVPRPLGVFIVYLGILVVFTILGFLLIQPIIHQVTRLSNDLPKYITQAQDTFTRLDKRVSNNPLLSKAIGSPESAIGGLARKLAPLLLMIPFLLGKLLFSVVAIIVMAFFWLTGVEHLRPFFVSLFPRHYQNNVSDILAEIGRKIGGYVRGVVVNMVVIGSLSGGADFALNVNYPVLLGIWAGMAELIPYFGPWIGGSAAVLVALITGSPIKALEVVGAYVIIQEIEGHTLVPFVMMHTVDLNPLTVIIAVLLGTTLLGIVGGVISVPTAAVIKVLMVRVVGPLARSASARVPDDGESAQPAFSNNAGPPKSA